MEMVGRLYTNKKKLKYKNKKKTKKTKNKKIYK
jgi:hypothetical protein